MNSFRTLFIPLNTHILFGMTWFFIIGITHAALSWPCFYYYTTVGVLFTICSVKTYITKEIALPPLLLIISFIGGHLRYQQHCTPYHLFNIQHQNASCNIKGTIITSAPVEHMRTKQCITLYVHESQTKATSLDAADIKIQEWQPVNMYIQIYTNTPHSHEISDVIQINNINLKKPSSASFFNYLMKEGIVSTVFCPNYDYILLDRPSYSFSRWIFTIKQNIFQRLQNKMPQKSFTLFASLFLGNRSLNKKEIAIIAHNFQQWGLSHYLARSGLHLTIFALIWHVFFRLLPLAFRLKQILLFILSLIYFIFSWSSISFLRAFYSFFLCTLCNVLFVRTYFLHILTLVTLFVLFLNPIQLFFLDFQLSFSLTCGLAWINHLYQPHKA